MIKSNDCQNILINACGVHTGGGYVLLKELIESIPLHLNTIIWVDQRSDIFLNKIDGIEFRVVKPNIFARFFAELNIKFTAKKGDSLLCIGNLPPLWRNIAYTTVFFQNRLILTFRRSEYLNDYDKLTHIKFFIRRIFLIFFSKNANQFIVQTESMLNEFKSFLPTQNVIALPFLGKSLSVPSKLDFFENLKPYSFIYVASGEPHKNHKRLIESWILLALEGHYPNLVLTLDFQIWPELCDWINSQTRLYRLNIVNIGQVNRETVYYHYSMSKALIYPSYVESFGLPLLEASENKLPIIAPELDYVRDVVVPTETFDPFSSLSIARAVLRFLGKSKKPLEISSVELFWQNLVGDEL